MKNQTMRSRARLNVRRGDMVKVLSGKDRGKTGRVLRVLTGKRRVLVEAVNFIQRHTRPSQRNQQGGVVEKEAPIDISNVMVLCNKCSQPTRVGRRQLEDGTRVRTCKRCGEVLDR